MPIVLLIDDNRMISFVEASYLQKAIANLDILVPSAGCCSLEMANTKNPDVTILDMGLVERDPIEMHKALCNTVSPESIIITTNDPSDELEQLKEAKQIRDVLVRPFSIDALIQAVTLILQEEGHTVVPYKSSIPPPINIETKRFDRHLALNQLSGILGAVRAMEAEMEAEPDVPQGIIDLLNEYIPHIVTLVNDVSMNIKLTRNSERLL